MKRFVVIVTSLFIIFVFIALNYLLWDRESLVNLRKSDQASIDALGRINMSLSNEKNWLEQNNDDLKNQIEELKKNIKELEANIIDQQQLIDNNTQFIIDMKHHINPEPLQLAVEEWVNLISGAKYDEAYARAASNCKFWGNIWTVRMFSDYFAQNVEQIQLILDDETSKPMAEVIPSQTADWEMNVSVHVQAVLKEGARQDYLRQEENILRFTFVYSERLEQWLINSITAEMDEGTESEPEENKAF